MRSLGGHPNLTVECCLLGDDHDDSEPHPQPTVPLLIIVQQIVDEGREFRAEASMARGGASLAAYGRHDYLFSEQRLLEMSSKQEEGGLRGDLKKLLQTHPFCHNVLL